MKILPFSESDQDATIELWKAAGVYRPWNDPHHDIAFAMQSPHAALFLAKEDSKIIGSVMVGEDGHRGWVYYLAVQPSYQKNGLGRALMEHAENWLKNRGIWKLQLLLRENNEASMNFYEHLGYRDTKTRCLQKIIG